MKLHLLVAIAVSLLAVGLARADSYSFKEPFTKTGPFSATGTLSLDNVNGNIEVRTWDKNEILIEGEKSAQTEEELKLIDLQMEVSDAHAVIKVRLPKRSGNWFSGNTIRAAVHFKITVPVAAVLDKISSVNSSITIENVRGAVHASSVNGAVHATGLGSAAYLETVNGSVRGDFASVAAGQELVFKTVNGGIGIRLPADAGATVRASVVNGNVDCDLPLTAGGKVHGHNLSGTIGDGRASLKAESVNGGIHIEKS